MGDLESFHYTTQWAPASSEGSDAGRIETDDLNILRARLSVPVGIRFRATHSPHRLRLGNREDIRKFGTFLPRPQPVLEEWYPSLLGLMKSWRTVKDGVGEADVSRYFIRHALVFAHREVADYLKIVQKYLESLESTHSFLFFHPPGPLAQNLELGWVVKDISFLQRSSLWFELARRGLGCYQRPAHPGPIITSQYYLFYTRPVAFQLTFATTYWAHHNGQPPL